MAECVRESRCLNLIREDISDELIKVLNTNRDIQEVAVLRGSFDHSSSISGWDSSPRRQLFWDAICSLPRLECLTIEGFDEELALAIRRHSSARWKAVSFLEVELSRLESLAKACCTLSHLHTIDISAAVVHVPMVEDEMSSLTTSSFGQLCAIPTLKSLSLADIQLSPQHIQAMATSLQRKDSSLEQLHIEIYDFSLEAFQELAQLLQANPSSLKDFHLLHHPHISIREEPCSSSSTGFVLLLESLRGNTNLKSLRLGSSKEFADRQQMAQAVDQMLVINQTLESLHLTTYMGMDDKGVELLATSGLRKNESLRSIVFGNENGQISSRGYKALYDMLSESNCTLRFINTCLTAGNWREPIEFLLKINRTGLRDQHPHSHQDYLKKIIQYREDLEVVFYGLTMNPAVLHDINVDDTKETPRQENPPSLLGSFFHLWKKTKKRGQEAP